MCMQLTVLLAAALAAPLMPKQSHWRFQGFASPNSTIKWSPSHPPPDGMAYIHVWGNGTLLWDQHEVPVNGHIFFHNYKLPTIHYSSSHTAAKSVSYVIV
jgi:hypothetical protein